MADRVTYLTSDGDQLDQVCRAWYGTEHGTVEKVLEANRHLAALGPVLDAGVLIFMPTIEAAAPEPDQPIRLWD